MIWFNLDRINQIKLFSSPYTCHRASRVKKARTSMYNTGMTHSSTHLIVRLKNAHGKIQQLCDKLPIFYTTLTKESQWSSQCIIGRSQNLNIDNWFCVFSIVVIRPLFVPSLGQRGDENLFLLGRISDFPSTINLDIHKDSLEIMMTNACSCSWAGNEWWDPSVMLVPRWWIYSLLTLSLLCFFLGTDFHHIMIQ